jgi:hypothetical protein
MILSISQHAMANQPGVPHPETASLKPGGSPKSPVLNSPCSSFFAGLMMFNCV